ncbi:MAG TPA: hypothetical protein [Bacteriophage sp.]|nr:MAG TPA: hypothetical protein [Bacteriophage sp.]
MSDVCSTEQFEYSRLNIYCQAHFTKKLTFCTVHCIMD